MKTAGGKSHLCDLKMESCGLNELALLIFILWRELFSWMPRLEIAFPFACSLRTCVIVWYNDTNSVGYPVVDLMSLPSRRQGLPRIFRK